MRRSRRSRHRSRRPRDPRPSNPARCRADPAPGPGDSRQVQGHARRRRVGASQDCGHAGRHPDPRQEAKHRQEANPGQEAGPGDPAARAPSQAGGVGPGPATRSAGPAAGHAGDRDGAAGARHLYTGAQDSRAGRRRTGRNRGHAQRQSRAASRRTLPASLGATFPLPVSYTARPSSRTIVRPRMVGGGTTCEPPRFAGANRSGKGP